MGSVETDYDWPALLRSCHAGALTSHLRRHPLPEVALRRAASEPAAGEPYGRAPVWRDDVGEVLLVKWREDVYCAPHDHGEASGFVQLLAGRFVERLWRWRAGELVVANETQHDAPTILRVGAHGIHDMKAVGGGLGIHFYLPAITGMKVFDRARRETLVVRDDCGAWIPAPEGDTGLVVSRAPF
ncbi:MAG TPA: hypothetical protein VK989_00615 [Polyangia bacterium]|jgi:hypothetical protein|nr:hypothetical protein [Polyangia bacterium]